jgi:LPS O-antigen subunit length determinant protein (WzzB/FepE family)
MPLDDEGEAEAVGAEKSPRKVGLFVLTLLTGIVIALGLVLLYLHFHTPTLR